MSAQDYFQGLALTAFQMVLPLAVLRACYRNGYHNGYRNGFKTSEKQIGDAVRDARVSAFETGYYCGKAQAALMI